MAKDRRSKDQKRKAQLAKKAQKARKKESAAYLGEKYKTEELIPLWMEAEIGIYEAYVITDRKLLDSDAATALETLVEQMRTGTLPSLSDDAELHYQAGKEADLVMTNIRHRWAAYFEANWRPPQDQRIGVLRTILGSIEKVRSFGPRSQSYMHHIAGFLTKKLGVKVEQFSADMERLSEPDEDELVQLGRRWAADEDQDAKADFHEFADELIRSGQPQRVLDACHRLIAEVGEPNSVAVDDLFQLTKKAQKSLVSSMG